MGIHVKALPPLPPELVHYIFDLAAASSRHSSLNICLVSSWAHHIALPYLFHTVILRTFAFSKLFERLLHHPYNSIGSVAPFVKNIWIESHATYSWDFIPIYEACDSVTHLAWNYHVLRGYLRLTQPSSYDDGETRLSDRAFNFTHDLHMTFIGKQYSIKPLSDRISTLFHRVTHIRLATLGFGYTIANTSYFDRLSHLSVPFCNRDPVPFESDTERRRPSDLQHLLDPTRKSLKMLVVVIVKDVVQGVDREELEEWVRGVRKTDRRLYVLEGHSLHFRDEWEEEMRGGESIWERAIRYTAAWEAGAIV
jgi:hypothetical protein